MPAARVVCALIVSAVLLLPASTVVHAAPTTIPAPDPVRTVRATTPAALVPAPAVARRWAVDDAPIARGLANRSWTWGPQIFRSALEPYAETPGALRGVWYLDKARMEVTQPGANAADPWFVTSGLLVRELMSGQVQTGDAAYESRAPADVPIAGDLDVPPDATITFLDLQPLAALHGDNPTPSRLPYDPVVVEVLHKHGFVSQDERLLRHEVRLASYDSVLGRHVASVFAEALPADQLLFIAGRPLTEPYWTTVPVGGTPREVLVQAFERRVLTYTPTNPDGWRVEWGNVGRQYAQWRYGTAASGPPLDPASALDPAPEPRALNELSATAAHIVTERDGQIGVAVLDMQRNLIYTSDGALRFPMYSTAKVPIMLGVLDQAQRENRPLAAWEDRLLRVMIQHSNNDAATELIGHVGGAARLERYLRSIGIADTRMDRHNWGYSTTTASDMARLMRKLGDCTILDAAQQVERVQTQRGVTPDQAWGVSAGVPDHATIALKNGWSPDSNGWAINSIGYVKGDGKQYAIAIYTRLSPSKAYGIATIEALAAQVWAALP